MLRRYRHAASFESGAQAILFPSADQHGSHPPLDKSFAVKDFVSATYTDMPRSKAILSPVGEAAGSLASERTLTAFRCAIDHILFPLEM
jgi:hypothetical protein